MRRSEEEVPDETRLRVSPEKYVRTRRQHTTSIPMSQSVHESCAAGHYLVYLQSLDLKAAVCLLLGALSQPSSYMESTLGGAGRGLVPLACVQLFEGRSGESERPTRHRHSPPGQRRRTAGPREQRSGSVGGDTSGAVLLQPTL